MIPLIFVAMVASSTTSVQNKTFLSASVKLRGGLVGVMAVGRKDLSTTLEADGFVDAALEAHVRQVDLTLRLTGGVDAVRWRAQAPELGFSLSLRDLPVELSVALLSVDSPKFQARLSGTLPLAGPWRVMGQASINSQGEFALVGGIVCSTELLHIDLF